MKRVLAGSSLFVGGSIIFAACTICASFEGVVPSEVQGEKFIAGLFMVAGIAAIIWGACREENK
mgnify:CR=1 FL=1